MRLNKWLRLGIVLSCAWVAGATVYATYSYRDHVARLEQSSFDVESAVPVGPSDTVPANLAGTGNIVERETLLLSCEGYSTNAECYVKKESLLMLLLLPVVPGWLLAAGALWVRAGFKRSAAPKP